MISKDVFKLLFCLWTAGMLIGCSGEDGNETTSSTEIVKHEEFTEPMKERDEIAKEDQETMSPDEQKIADENQKAYTEEQAEKIEHSPFKDISLDSLPIVYDQLARTHAANCEWEELVKLNKMAAEDPLFVQCKTVSERKKKVTAVYIYSKHAIDSCKTLSPPAGS